MMLPSKLRDLRKKHGLSQKELAEKLIQQFYMLLIYVA